MFVKFAQTIAESVGDNSEVGKDELWFADLDIYTAALANSNTQWWLYMCVYRYVSSILWVG